MSSTNDDGLQEKKMEGEMIHNKVEETNVCPSCFVNCNFGLVFENTSYSCCMLCK